MVACQGGGEARGASFFACERDLSPVRKRPRSDATAGAVRTAGRADRLLLAFRPPGQRPVRGAVRRGLPGRDAGFHDPGVHGPGCQPGDGERSGPVAGRAVATPARDGRGAPHRPPPPPPAPTPPPPPTHF